MPWELLSLPVIGALIGWLTNRVAVIMLFRPRRPWRLPLIGLAIQGVLPRRHADLARLIGETVERDLLSADTLVEVFESGHYREQIVTSVQDHLAARLKAALSRFVPPGLQQSIIRVVTDWVGKETEQLWDHLQSSLSQRIREDVDVAALVEERILRLDLDQLERMVTRVSASELRFIEVIGGVLGAVIGLVQVGFLLAVGASG